MKRAWLLLLIPAAAAVYWWPRVATWAQWQGGFRPGDGNGSHYLFVSGTGSIILPPLLTLTGVAALWAWHNQCHATGCYWPSRRVTAANEKVCWRHAPERHRTAEQIREAHHLYLGKQPGKG